MHKEMEFALRTV